MEFASYISGFTDGEGTFSVSFSQCLRLKTRIEARPSFSISQHKRSKEILLKIKKHFSVGRRRNILCLPKRKRILKYLSTFVK